MKIYIIREHKYYTQVMDCIKIHELEVTETKEFFVTKERTGLEWDCKKRIDKNDLRVGLSKKEAIEKYINLTSNSVIHMQNEINKLNIFLDMAKVLLEQEKE